MIIAHSLSRWSIRSLSLYIGRTHLFPSDIYIKRNVEINQAFVSRKSRKRNTISSFSPKRRIPSRATCQRDDWPWFGYAGTEHGITFRAGLRYDSKTMFFDFQRKGNRFVAELVSVYDPPLRSIRLVSKHLHPGRRVHRTRSGNMGRARRMTSENIKKYIIENKDNRQ